jgi:hypothetical protein
MASDRKLEASSEMKDLRDQAMNRVVEKMKFDIVGGYSNMLGGGKLDVSLAVRDVTPSTITACERAQTLFGASACTTANVAKTIVKVSGVGCGV